MQKVLGALLVIILLAACKKELPEGIIDRSAMTNLLYDLHLAEAYGNTAPLDTARLSKDTYYRSVFQKYGVDSAGFRHNLEYYAAQPATLQDIYAEISKRYRALENVYMQQRDSLMRATVRADSLERANYQDSVRKLRRDSILYAQKKHLLYWKHPDSAHLRPPAWDADVTMNYWMEVFYADSARFKNSPVETTEAPDIPSGHDPAEPDSNARPLLLKPEKIN